MRFSVLLTLAATLVVSNVSAMYLPDTGELLARDLSGDLELYAREPLILPDPHPPHPPRPPIRAKTWPLPKPPPYRPTPPHPHPPPPYSPRDFEDLEARDRSRSNSLPPAPRHPPPRPPVRAMTWPLPKPPPYRPPTPPPDYSPGNPPPVYSPRDFEELEA